MSQKKTTSRSATITVSRGAKLRGGSMAGRITTITPVSPASLCVMQGTVNRLRPALKRLADK